MRLSPRRLARCLLILIAVVPTGSASGQQLGEAPKVQVVTVEVFVTDRQGRPALGLTREDFVIREDGRPMAVTNFHAEHDGRSPGGDGRGGQASPAQQATTAPDLSLAVYFDSFNLRPSNRGRALRALRAFLARATGPRHQVTLVSYDRKLHLRRDFTTDLALVNASIAELENVTGRAVDADVERRAVLGRIASAESMAAAERHARSYAEGTFNDLSLTIDALGQAIDSLAGLPGRKALIYVSDGLAMVAGQDAFHAVQQKYPGAANLTLSFAFDASRRFNELAATANRNRVTLYTLDAAGLRTAKQAVSGTDPSPAEFIDSIHISNLHSPLELLAEKTGGQAILNTDDFASGLAAVLRDLDTYYSLDYVPPHFGDGRYHRIEVSGRSDLVFRHRQGYRDTSIHTRMTEGTIAALSLAFAVNPLGVGLDLGPPERRDDGSFLVPVRVTVPIGNLVLLPNGTTHNAQVRLFFAVRDSEGGTSDVQQVAVPIAIPAADLAAARSKSYTYSVSLLMRGGDHQVAAGIYDDASGESSFVSRAFKVGG